ncbi:hypothetical protein [Roseiterribacter gracilis]|uniref:Uncharacterized protein n=1 Tax=Roseiterribacter gracilis TaxID=2812848 RepID=A0A8S8XCS9_9PROT|nr:hypothetical protein TMPK1_35100 [Rhodospirillales bacterium TMPK1]
MSLALADDPAADIEDAIDAFRAGRIVRAERIARAVLQQRPDEQRARSLLALLFPEEVAAPALLPPAYGLRPADAPPIERDAPQDPLQVADALRRSSRTRARAFLQQHLDLHGEDAGARLQAQRLASEAGAFDVALQLTPDTPRADPDKQRKFATNLLRLGLARQTHVQGELDDDLPNLFLVALARFEDMQPAATRITIETMARLDPTSAWTRLARALAAMQAGDQQDAGFQLAQAQVAAEQQAARGTAHPSLSRFVALLSGWFGSDDTHARAERMRTAIDGLPQLARWRGRVRRLVPEQIPDWQVAWILRDDVIDAIDAGVAQITPGEIAIDILPGSGLTSLFAALAGAQVFVLVGHPGQAAALQKFFDENLSGDARTRVQLLQTGINLPVDRTALDGASADWIIAEAAPPCIPHARLFESASYWAATLGTPATRFLPEAIEFEIALAKSARRPCSNRLTKLGSVQLGQFAWSGASLRITEQADPIVQAPLSMRIALGTVPVGELVQLGRVGDATHVQIRQTLLYGGTRLDGAILQLAFEPVADAADRVPTAPAADATAAVLLAPDDVLAFATAAVPSNEEVST